MMKIPKPVLFGLNIVIKKITKISGKIRVFLKRKIPSERPCVEPR